MQLNQIPIWDWQTKCMKGEIGEEEFVERYNRLIEQEAEKHWEPVKPHEHI